MSLADYREIKCQTNEILMSLADYREIKCQTDEKMMSLADYLGLIIGLMCL